MSKMKTILNFSLNGLSIVSRDENDKWHLFKKEDEHFQDDPNDLFHKEDNAKNESLENIAKSGNKTISEVELDMATKLVSDNLGSLKEEK